jgi:hypothetical protein
MVIKGKLSTVSMTKGRGCPGPYMKRKHRMKVEHIEKHIEHSMRGRGHIPKGGSIGERLARWNVRLREATRWVANDQVGRRAT